MPTQRGLNFQFHALGSGIRTPYNIPGSGVRTHGSIVRNNIRNEGVANVAGYTKSSCKKYRLAMRLFARHSPHQKRICNISSHLPAPNDNH